MKIFKYQAAVVIAIALLASPLFASESENVSVVIPKGTEWSLRPPKTENVTYHGIVNFDKAGVANAQIAYPAPSALGFLAAVFTHGAIVSSEKDKQKDKFQEEADKVLAPYEAILKEYRYSELMQRALEMTTVGGSKQLISATEKSVSGWVIESVPIYSMTQDRSAIVLQNAIAIYPPSGTEPAYQNAVKIVSEPNEDAKAIEFWRADDGKMLKGESARLLARSIDIALAEATGGPVESGRQKTFRYLEGSSEKMERAELVSQHCHRVVIRTLRGWLMSVPLRKSDRESCADVANTASR